MTTISIRAAREKFSTIIDDASEKLKSFTITKNGKARAMIISIDEYESWKETIDILSNKDLMESIRRGEADIKAGRTVSLEEYAKRCIR